MKDDRQKFMDYIHFLDRKYGVGNISQANKEEIKKLRKLEPKREPKLSKYYIKLGYTSLDQLKNDEFEMYFSQKGTDRFKIREALKEKGIAYTSLGVDYGISNIIPKLNGKSRWSAEDLETICKLLDFEVEELVKRDEPLDRNILIPINWVRVVLINHKLKDLTIEEFTKRVGGVKKRKLKGQTRFTLEQLKNAADVMDRDLKAVMTKKGYKNLGVELDGYRDIESE